jgi:predicted glycosyltransferase
MNRRSPRIVLFGHDTFGLGHLRRNLTIAHQLARDLSGAQFLGLTGSPQAHAFAVPPRFDFVKLPSATKHERGGYGPLSLDLTLDELTGMRSRLIGETLLSFRPDVVLVDHAPAGMEGELVAPLNRLRAEHPGVALVLGLRDVIDDPERVRQEWERLGIFDWMDRTYDRVLIYGAHGVGPLPEEYGLSPRLNGRVRFMQYVHDVVPRGAREETRRRLGLGEEPLIVATVGGGGDGEMVLHRLLEALAEKIDWPGRFWVVTGPLMHHAAAARIRERARLLSRVRVVEFDPELPLLLDAADAVLSMAGYNSTLEILASGAPAVFVPRTRPRREQWIRATAMERLGLCEVVDPDHATPRRLASALRAALARGRRTEPLPLELNGARNVSREVQMLLDERGIAVQGRVA